MLKRLILIAAILAPALCWGQSTVSGTVTDAGSQTWNNGTYSFSTLAIGIAPVTGSLSASGTYTATLPSNSPAVTAAGNVWSFQVCTSFAIPVCYTSSVTVTLSVQTVNATPPAITLTAGLLVNAYADAEIANPVEGSFYWNVTNAAARVYHSGAWQNLAGGGGIGYPGAGVPNSTGSAWGTSYTVGSAASDLVQLNGSGQLPAVSAALLTNFPTFNQSTTGTASNLSGTPALPNGTTATTQTGGDNTTKIATDAFVLANDGGANTALSNLAAVALNTSLLPATSASADIGSTSLPFGNVFFKTSLNFTETTAPSGAAGHDVCYGDSAVHSIECNLNNVGFHVMATTGLDLSGTGGGGTTVSGLKGNTLPSLATGFLNWTGSAWALSAAGAGSSTFDSTSIGQPAATAAWTFPVGDGFTLAGTAPVSVSTSTGTNATSDFAISGIAGGATSNATGTGGIGSSPSIVAGIGGAGTGTNAVGGAGGGVAFTTGAGGASNGTGVNSNGGNFTVTLGAPGTGGSGTAGNYGFFKVVAGTAAAVQTAFQVCPPTGTCFFQVGTGNGNGDINGSWSVGSNLSVNSNSTAAGFALEFNAQADKILNTTTNANTDIQGQLTLTAATNSTQTYTFKTGGLTYTNAPTCVVSAQSSLLGGATSWAYTVSNTALVITQTGVSTSSVIYDYICFGHGV